MEIMWKEVNIIICTFFQKANEKDETMFKLAKPLSILVETTLYAISRNIEEIRVLSCKQRF